MRPKTKTLAAISCKVLPDGTLMTNLGLLKRFNVQCQSDTPDIAFAFDTGPLHPDLLPKFQVWQAHGFTVLEVQDEWLYQRYDETKWVNLLTTKALEQVATTIETHGEQIQMAGYDKVLAREVLLHLDKVFPDTLSNMEIKHQLTVEPSDQVLLAALEALKKQGFIEGHEKRENTTGAHRLIALRSIGITPAGQTFLEGQTSPSPVANYYINHGQAGAMGPYSSGTVNYQHHWSQVENELNLSAIADQFDDAIKHRMALSPSSADFAELQLMAQAKEQAQKHEGGKLMETVSLIGKSAVPILTKAGANALVSWLEHKMGTKLS